MSGSFAKSLWWGPGCSVLNDEFSAGCEGLWTSTRSHKFWQLRIREPVCRLLHRDVGDSLGAIIVFLMKRCWSTRSGRTSSSPSCKSRLSSAAVGSLHPDSRGHACGSGGTGACTTAFLCTGLFEAFPPGSRRPSLVDDNFCTREHLVRAFGNFRL